MIDLSKPKKKTEDQTEFGKLILFMVPILTAALFLIERGL